ncbi:SRPBCC domain-containing protein [Hyphococcus sp.]|uniref:SRPBCC domain-containing protein n=1 Tax=Hyphococcus sp. TaxID=2038636 RepID=UPI0035C77A1E
MSAPDIVHASLTVTRDYDHPPERVFAAWSSAEAKRQWFGADSDGFEIEEYKLDFRPGGSERCHGRKPGGGMFSNDGVYHYIVENEKIVLTYYMTIDGAPYSVSLTIIELTQHGKGTRLKLIEDNAFLTGVDENAGRTKGWTWVLGRIDEELNRQRLS